MRNMSFALTTEQLLAGTKTVTRRVGWWGLKAGDRVQAVKKAMGLRKGEKMERLCVIEIVSVSRWELQVITPADVKREGFPAMTRDDFIAMFCLHMKCCPTTYVNRIEFRRVSA